MSARVRKDGRVLCAAMHPAEDGDIYIDDGAHYLLAVTEVPYTLARDEVDA